MILLGFAQCLSVRLSRLRFGVILLLQAKSRVEIFFLLNRQATDLNPQRLESHAEALGRIGVLRALHGLRREVGKNIGQLRAFHAEAFGLKSPDALFKSGDTLDCIIDVDGPRGRHNGLGFFH